MTDGPPRGELRLRSSARPPLEPGGYELRLNQEISEGGQSLGALQGVVRHVELSAPRFNLPAAELHSVFPPPNAVGAFDNRLAQVALRRRTLPWERRADAGDQNPPVPWLALVLLADGEANFLSGIAIEDAVPAEVGTRLGVTETGTCDALEVSDEVLKQAFPAREEVELLCHVRQVNLEDSEFAGTDDDGFLAVVVCNRLPRPGRRYGAYLISLEGRLDALPPRGSAAPSETVGGETVYDVSPVQLQAVSYLANPGATLKLSATEQPALEATGATKSISQWNVSSAIPTAAPADAEPALPVASLSQAFLQHAVDFTALHAEIGEPEPELERFVVLQHWSFTCAEGGDFQTLMSKLHVGLLGTPPADEPPPGYEVADTGHTVIDHVTRRGDPARAWYRGPFVPREVTRPAAGTPYRAADKIRRVAEDGREDLSIAAAFELGRLLALSDERFLSLLQAWRRGGLARRRLAAQIMGATDVTLDPDATSTAQQLGVDLIVALSTPDDDTGATPLGEPVARDDVDHLLEDDDAGTIASGLGLPVELVDEVLSSDITQAPLEPERFQPDLIADFDELAAKKQTLEPLVGRLTRTVEQIVSEMTAEQRTDER
jgi:hypothetical protein